MKSDSRALPLLVSAFALFLLHGCGSSSNSSGQQQPPPDTTAPTLGAVQVPEGSSLNRTVTLSVSADDNVGVTEVRFLVDGDLLASDTSAPYSVDWDTTAEMDGDHTLRAEADDAAGNTAQSGELVVTVANVRQFAITLTGDEEVPPVSSTGTADANLTVNLGSGSVEGELMVSGIDATAAHIHDGFAGSNGPVNIGLEQDAGDPSVFAVPADAMLDAAGIDRLLAGGLYLNVHTAANPGGELRGQILPEDVVLYFTALSGDSEVPQVDTLAEGRAAVTLNEVTGALVVQAQVANLPSADQAHVHDGYAGANGPVLVALAQDPMDDSRWFVEDAELGGAGLDAFAAGRLYVNVHSPDHPGGEIRGQIIPDGITLLSTELSGEQQVPAVDTSATGTAFLTLDEAASLVSIHVNTERFADASAAHLHGEYGGANGPVEIGLVQDGSEPSHWFAEEEMLSAEQLDALLAGATYLNVHSPAFPDGEIRGQVIPDAILFATGRLEGAQEVPAVTTTAGGTFAVTVDPAASTLVAHANTTGADDATAAHLHDGYAGISGPVSIGLTQDAGNVSRWSVIDAPLTTGQLTAFTSGRFYVNVHTPANPGGEIRGQVAPPPVEVLFAAMSGEQEVPALASAASGTAAVTVDRDTGRITVHVRASGADDATAAHVHRGYAGQNGPVLIGLTQDTQDTGHWFVVEAQFDSDGRADYLAGRSYVNLHTPANPGGELRGQLVPQDIEVLFSEMDGDQVVPPVTTAASGTASSTIDHETRELVVYVNSTGVDDATSASIRIGDAGSNGPEVFGLDQTPMQPAQWSGTKNPLADDEYQAYRAGRLYAEVATPAEPDGEIRGQIVPPDAALFDDQAPVVELASPGMELSGSVSLEATASDNQGVTIVRFLADGVVIDSDTTAPYSIEWDTTSVADGDYTLTAEAEDEAGNVGTSADVMVTVMNAAPVTLTQIQDQVFTPTCSACHTGPTSNVLPSGMNLSSTADSFAALVGVASIQVPSLERVTPGNPDDSYLIRKLEGTASVGTRMPQGGPFLEQDTIDMIRQWILDGAPNN